MLAGHKKSENTQGLHEDQDVIPQLSEQSHDEALSGKDLKNYNCLVSTKMFFCKPIRHALMTPLTKMMAEIKKKKRKGILWGYKFLQASNLLE